MQLFLTTESLNDLRSNIEKNLAIYRGEGDFAEIKLLDTDVQIDADLDSLLVVGDHSTDIVNCEVVFSAFASLTPSMARDQRLWVYLTHGPMLEYCRTRWPIPEDDKKAVEHIKSKFFADNARSIESRNAISRFYWTGHLASQVDNEELTDVLNVLFSSQRVIHDLIERPSAVLTSQVFKAVVRKMLESQRSDGLLFEQNNFRELQRRINSMCGSVAVECLADDVVYGLVGDIVNDVLLKAAA